MGKHEHTDMDEEGGEEEVIMMDMDMEEIIEILIVMLMDITIMVEGMVVGTTITMIDMAMVAMDMDEEVIIHLGIMVAMDMEWIGITIGMEGIIKIDYVIKGSKIKMDVMKNMSKSR